MTENLANFTDVFGDDEICDSQQSQPISLPSSIEQQPERHNNTTKRIPTIKGAGQYNDFRSVEEIDTKYRDVFVYPFFNLVQSRVIEDALYSDKSIVVCAPTGSGKTVIFEMAIVQLLMEMEEKKNTDDFKIIYMAPVKALCTERLTEWYSKFTRLGILCIEVTGDTDVDFTQLQAYKIIITTPEKWDMLTRRWKDHRGLVEVIKLFLIDEVHILNDETRGPVLEAVVSRMKTIQSAAQLAHRIEKLQKEYQTSSDDVPRRPIDSAPTIRFVAVSATVSNPEDVAAWLKTDDKPAVYHKFGDECRPVKLRRVVEGYPCPDGTSIFKFDIILNYKLWPIIQKYHDGKPTLIFCNTRKSVLLTAETLSREITITFNPEQKVKLTALASTIKNKKLQSLVLAGVGCHHAGMLYEERTYIEHAFRNGDLPILITTTTLAMGVNLPAHLVIIKNTQQYVNGAYQEYSISTVLQMVGRAGRPQFDTEATAVIMTRQRDKARYQALAGGSEPLQSYLHKRLAENLNSETALGTVCDVAQCVQWLRSTFLFVRAAKDPKRYLGLSPTAPEHLILKKIEELCVRAMNGLASAGLITMDEACCIKSTEAGRLMSVFYLDLETMKLIMKIQGNESLERLLWIICECHELADMHLRTDERRTLNALNRNNAAATIRFPMKGKISTRQMKLNCLIQSILGCLPIPDPSLNQEGMKIMRIADRICKCLVAYVTRPEPVTLQLQYFSAVLNSIILAKCIAAHLWENSPYVSKQLKGIGPTFSTLLATAGKCNFMLLEESHPRDLERIMNKGPPAGNVLRKQISLLPKYQLEATPVNEKYVSVKLLLLNQSYLSENIENLTAGATHKCYIIAGDSENHILLLTTFMDKDLISIYDGNITYEIMRKHSFEHKIYIHCVSSNIAGVDAQCEYTFKDLMPAPSTVITSCFVESKAKPITKRQSNIFDIPKERKRKNNADEITQSKEKKKRDNAFTEKIRLLKESFGRTTSALKKEVQSTKEMTNNSLNNCDYTDLSTNNIIQSVHNDIHTRNIYSNADIMDANTERNFPENDDYIMDDAKIDSILNEIESEITKVSGGSKKQVTAFNENKVPESISHAKFSNILSNAVKENQRSLKRTNKADNTKSNYNFLDLLEKNVDLSDDDVPVQESGFSDAIKLHVEKYIQDSYKASPTLDLAISNLYTEPSVNKSTDIHLCEQNITEIHDNLEILESFDRDKKHKNTNQNKMGKINNSFDEEFPEIDVGGSPSLDKNKNLAKSDLSIIAAVTNTYNLITHPNQNLPESKPLFNLGKDIKPIICNNNLEEKSDNDTVKVKSPHDKQLHLLVPSCIELASVIEPHKPCNLSTITKLSLMSESNEYYKPNKEITNDLKIQKYTIETPEVSGSDIVDNDLLSSNKVKQTKEATISNLQNHYNKPEYKNKYSFSTEKVDVQTKYTSDHKIRIIRRLKVDLDVTEIVSLYNFKNDKNIVYNNFINKQKSMTNKSSPSYLQSECKNNYNTECFTLTEYPSRCLQKDMFKNFDVTNETIENSLGPNYLQSENVCDAKMYSMAHNHSQQKELSKVDADNKDKGELEEHNIVGNLSRNNIQDLEYHNDKIYDEKRVNKSPPKLVASTNDMTNPISNEKSIKNILHKYSNSIRKTQNKDLKQSPRLPTNSANNIPQPHLKPNRPFKITDIHYVNVSLPTLCENVKPLSANTPQAGNVQTSVGNRTEISQNQSDVQIFLQTPLKYQQLSPCQSPEKILEQSLDISEDDLNIDQSMFNPKTLLQNIGKDDIEFEIIPPPPEFSTDDINYSPDINENLGSQTDLEEFNQTLEDIHKLSVFQGVFPEVAATLTPSEIETWTLDRHDEFNKRSCATPTQSYTVLRRKMFQNDGQLQDNNLKREGKLSQFMFKRKNKLKL